MTHALAAGAEETPRRLEVFVVACAVASVAFHLYLIFSGLLPALVTRPLHLALAMPWVFFFAPGGSRLSVWSGRAAGVIGFACCLWVAANRHELA
ncbi:MAG TPA: hypothetical protein VK943_08365, partial [Arenibaculum sp.]|nr:hypothetical protein [Arenibaculum sp.]